MDTSFFKILAKNTRYVKNELESKVWHVSMVCIFWYAGQI